MSRYWLFLLATMLGCLVLSIEAQGRDLTPSERLVKISQALRNGKLPEKEWVEKAQAGTVDFAALSEEWLQSPEFDTGVREWHRKIFRSPFLMRSDIEVLEDAPEGVRESLAEEPVRLALFVIQNELPYSELLTSRMALRNSILTRFYAGRDPTGAAIDDWKPVWRDEYESGVLTMRSMHLRNPTTVVNRWRTHAAQVLIEWACQDFLPTNVAADENDEAHGTDPQCAGCHRPLDSVGSFFTRWDRAGVIDFDASIDDRGTFYETANITYEGRGLRGLGQVLADSQRFPRCVVDKTWTFLTGRHFTEQETQARSDFLSHFWRSEYNLKRLIQSMVLSSEFAIDHEER